jgi:hypothetical protein
MTTYKLIVESEGGSPTLSTRDEIDVSREAYIGLLELIDEIWQARQVQGR